MPNSDQPAGIAADIGFETDDIDAMQEQAARHNWDAQYTQLENGAFNAQYEAWGLPGLSVLREHYGRKIQLAGGAPSSQITFVASNTDSGGLLCNYQPMQSGRLVAMKPGQNVEFIALAAVEVTSVQIDPWLVEQVARALYGDDFDQGLDYGRVLSVDASLFASLSEMLPKPSAHGDLLPAWSDGATAKSYFASALTERLTRAIVGDPNQVSSLRTNGGERSYRVAHRARDFIEANLHQSISRGELCVASGASLRVLHDSFLNCYGVAPVAYHRFRRLKLVHDRLRNGHPAEMTVSDAALAFGFSHFGRFAGQYKAIFGESPSSALANSRP